MTISRFLLLAMLAASATLVSGCPGDGSHPAIAMRPNANSVAAPDKTHDLVTSHGRPATKGASREAFLSTYSNPEQGVSFRYPRYYALEEGELEEHSFFLKRQDDLDLEQPGATLVATVLIPEDGYPNTTFEHGSLQLLVNDSATPQICKDLPGGGDPAAASALKNMMLQGGLFRGTEWQYETAGTQAVERRYAGFANGQCYEFRLVVAAEIAAEPEGITKPADEMRILRQLEKIVGSVRFHPRRPAPTEELNADGATRL
jgi:hypothetical protein